MIPRRRGRIVSRLNVYESALDLIGHTPILHLRSFDRPDAARIYAKLEFLSPGGSVKDRAALGMILDAEGRGLLRTGAFADVVVFDPARVADTATYDQPISASVGVTAVYVNGARATPASASPWSGLCAATASSSWCRRSTAARSAPS